MGRRPWVSIVSALSLAALVALLAACGPDNYLPQVPPQWTMGSSPIVGGTTDSGDSNVVLILVGSPPQTNPQFLCTGTLISPNAVLTAGHCSVSDDTCNGGGGPSTCSATPASEYLVLGGTSPINSSTWAITSPTWQANVVANHPNPSYGSDSTGAPHDDVAVLTLGTITVNSGSAPTPMPWLSSTNESAFATGTGIRAVGYGITNGTTGAGVGTKRTVTMQIQSHDSSTFQFGSSTKNTCSGDSGGPAIETINGVDTLVGTTSYGDQSCTQLGVDMRVDANAAFIGQYASGGGTPTPTPTSTSTPSPTPTPPPTGGQLSNGVPVSGISGSSGSQQEFTISLPSGASNLKIAITGSTSASSDADLYVRFGAAPTLSTYDCRPYLVGSNESCTFASPQAGTWYVMLNGYSAYSGVTLTATWSTSGGGGGGGGNGTALTNGVAMTGLSGTSGSNKYYYLSVPAGASTLTVQITGSTSASNDADLYVRFGAAPTLSTWDCRPYRTGSNETCTFSNPPAGAADIMLNGYTAYSGVSLKATAQ